MGAPFSSRPMKRGSTIDTSSIFTSEGNQGSSTSTTLSVDAIGEFASEKETSKPDVFMKQVKSASITIPDNGWITVEVTLSPVSL